MVSGPETSEVQFPLRVIGTFDPSEGLFCWADCDSFIPENCRTDLSSVRKLGDQVGAPELTVRNPQKMKFNDVSAMIALAGQIIDCDGVFRGINGDHSSMFVALYDSTDRKNNELTSDDKRSALEFLERYMTLQAPLDDEYFATEDSEAREVIFEKRLAIFRDHWGNHDAYWEPRSFSSPSNFDPDQYGFKHAAQSPQRGVQVILQGGSKIRCFLLEKLGKDWKIVSENLDFGNYVLWVD